MTASGFCLIGSGFLGDKFEFFFSLVVLGGGLVCV